MYPTNLSESSTASPVSTPPTSPPSSPVKLEGPRLLKNPLPDTPEYEFVYMFPIKNSDLPVFDQDTPLHLGVFAIFLRQFMAFLAGLETKRFFLDYRYARDLLLDRWLDIPQFHKLVPITDKLIVSVNTERKRARVAYAEMPWEKLASAYRQDRADLEFQASNIMKELSNRELRIALAVTMGFRLCGELENLGDQWHSTKDHEILLKGLKLGSDLLMEHVNVSEKDWNAPVDRVTVEVFVERIFPKDNKNKNIGWTAMLHRIRNRVRYRQPERVHNGLEGDSPWL